MTYNSDVRQTAVTIGAEVPSRSTWRAGRLAWVLAVISILVAVASLITALNQAVISGDYRTILSHQTLTPFTTIGFAVVGALIASRHSRNPIGWIFISVSILYALVALTAALLINRPASSPVYVWAAWFGSWLWIPAILLPSTFVLLVFPDGHLPAPGWRVVAWSAALGMALVLLVTMVYPGPNADLGREVNPAGIQGEEPILDVLNYLAQGLLAVGVIGSLAAYFVRFRRSRGNEREQMKWLVYAVGLYLLLGILSYVAWLILPDSRWMQEVNIALTDLGIFGIAAAAAIAILRHQLYDIDLIINRTLVYTALTAGVAALYGLVVGGLGVLFQARSSLLVSLLATGLAAILIQPLRDRLQRFVNRLMYGERDDPYAVLSGLSRRLESLLAPEDALPTVVETIAQALKLPYVAIALKQEGSFETAASYGTPGERPIQLPLIYQGEMVGQLRLSPRAPNEPFTPGEQRLLHDIARHIGVTAHNVLLTRDLRRLAEDLQRSREELVKGREEDRRRLRRDLHDELGPQLASLKLNLGVARSLVGRDPRAAEALLAELGAQSQAAIADIRRLVYDLRPPALDELGLIGAIQEYTQQIGSKDGIQIQLDSPKSLPALPAAVEVAAYRITLEALANFVRHSQGSNCRVSIARAGQMIQIEVSDNGQGLPGDLRPGVGLNSMRERAAELGGTCLIETQPHGGTRVQARLPLG